ncbi:hypothetical protein SS37A_14350 [Methylocystis iwaonis]|uniref:Uncharacterized protein n=1 Tax=Methylocystis iwaonis TaxID=2885079 RepID=A0ABN6VE83_9HYPH|nr:hypothetical protein SS37A_14350 [Methylocystis iwaonis]
MPRIGCKIPIPTGGTPPGSLVPTSPIPLPAPIQAEIDKLGQAASRKVEKLGGDTLTTVKESSGDTIRALQKAGGDTIATVQKAGDDSIKTIYKAAGDATATYVKAWRDIGEQGKRSFKDIVDAGQAVVHFVENENNAHAMTFSNAEKRMREGKVIDSMWGLATEPAKSGEENFAKATQESEVVNAAAATAAAAYGGPAGAAAYAAWSTYRRTGNADMAIRAGILAAVTAQTGSSIAKMPSGTTDEIIKKAALSGAAGGISVAAAGGDEQAIKDGFLKSAGAVLIQGGSDKLKAYSPEAKEVYETARCISARDLACMSGTLWARDVEGKILYDENGKPRIDPDKLKEYTAKAKDAYDAVQCISARDVDCISNTTWARDVKGKILYDENGKPRIDTGDIDPKQYVGKWSGLDPKSAEGVENALITQGSKLPKMEAIPVLKNKWVLTWALGQDAEIEYKKPTVVLSYIGDTQPYVSAAQYSLPTSPAPVDNTSLEGASVFSGVTVAYYVKRRDGTKISDVLQQRSIPYTPIYYVAPGHEGTLSNALRCGPDTPVKALKEVAFALMDEGVELKYIETQNDIRPRQILIVNSLNPDFSPMTSPSLTRNQIAALSECPSWLQN